MSLEKAPQEVQLAVDLIVILEESQIDPEIVLVALDIVKTDYQKKLLAQTQKSTNIDNQ